jgi:hypothetical protein
MHRIADHDSSHGIPAAQAPQRSQVFSPVGSPAAAPLKREHGLRRQAQLVRHGHADAAGSNVKSEIAPRAAGFHYAVPHIQLTALSHQLL